MKKKTSEKLDILFVIDSIETLNLQYDTSYAIMKEVYKRSHSLWIAEVRDIHLKKSVPFGHLTSLAIDEKNQWKKLFTQKVRLDGMNVILMRKDPPTDNEYMVCAQILSLVKKEKTFVINDPKALINFNEKLGVLAFHEFAPDLIVSKKASDFLEFLKKHKKIVLKPLHSYGGTEIVVIKFGDKNTNSLIEILTKNGKRYIMAQKYLDAQKYGDKRVLILNGEILGQEKRVASKFDYRNNIVRGGASHKTTLSRREREICGTVAEKLKNMGIFFAGIDLIEEKITEINITSTAAVVEINKHEHTKLEEKIVDFLEKYSYA